VVERAADEAADEMVVGAVQKAHLFAPPGSPEANAQPSPVFLEKFDACGLESAL
jgi:hypothetical protein